MAWRLVLTAIALWWGYNAIQMFDCTYVHFSSGIAYCSEFSLGGGFDGAAMGGMILTVVVLVLIAVWVSAFIQFREAAQADEYFRLGSQRQVSTRKQPPPQNPMPSGPTPEEQLASFENLHRIGQLSDEHFERIRKRYSDLDHD